MTAPIALITGASRGLGRSMALKLAAQGVDILLKFQTRSADADAVAAQITALGRKAVALPLDVSDSSRFAAFATAVTKALADHWQADRFDYLVNNAGVGAYAPFETTTEADFDAMTAIHLRGPFFLTQNLLPLIADGGRIVNVSSGLTRFTMPGFAAYAAMKGGVEVLTRYLAKELGARGIVVNTVAPGAIETDFGGGMVRDDADLNRTIASQTALGRVGRPDDIGGAVASLLLPANGWINGQRIEISGGVQL